jgi:hypothetical protein
MSPFYQDISLPNLPLPLNPFFASSKYRFSVIETRLGMTNPEGQAGQLRKI